MWTEAPTPGHLDEDEWRHRAERHRERVDAWVGDRLARRSAGRSHPVDDFLFDYYPYSVGRLTAWHPGHGVEVRGDVRDFLSHPDYVRTTAGATTDADRIDRHRRRLDLAIGILGRTRDRDAAHGCFGMHEWAMVYGLQPEQARHSSRPLRLAPDEIADVVHEVGLRCTHFDAYRFFTPAATPLNAHVPTRADQAEWEQPGCLHANMDLYKYAMWLSPFVGSDLVADCFALARRARILDMEAAPYDLVDLGFEPVPVETAAGRREYVVRQRAIADVADPLRSRLLAALVALRAGLAAAIPSP